MTLTSSTRKILILAANPKNTSRLRLEEEVREIDEGLKRSQKRDQFQLEQRWAVRQRDFYRGMLDIQPQIVHFCGHAEGQPLNGEAEGELIGKGNRKLSPILKSSESDEGIVLEDELGQAKLVARKALASLFQLFASKGLECVVLNACYSYAQAQTISEYVPYVIGMKQAIGDQAAIIFSVAFYDALGAGESYEFAFNLACAAIQFAGIPEHHTPALYQSTEAKGAVQRSYRESPKRKINLLRAIHWRGIGKLILTSVIVTALIIGPVRTSGMLQAFELKAFDQLMRMRPLEGADPRLLIVEAREEDVTEYGYPLSDAILAQVITTLEKYKPRIIGLNIFRDKPVGKGYAAFSDRLQKNERLVVVCSSSESSVENKPGIAPLTGIPTDRVGFSDVPEDPDGIIRRQILFMEPEPGSSCQTPFSFGVLTALHYLDVEGIKPRNDPMELGNVTFQKLASNMGAYQRTALGGYQILLNYCSCQEVAQRIRLKSVLEGQIRPEAVKDRIVLISVTAPSTSPYLPTPHSEGGASYQKVPGVILQANIISQILRAVKEGRPLLGFWSPKEEIVWVWSWSLLGGVLVWKLRKPLYLGLSTGLAITALYSICLVLLLQGIWVPLVPAALVMLITGVGIALLRISQFHC